MVISETYLRSFVPQRFIEDERYRSGHVHILAPAPGTLILGMHTPEMKQVAKELSRSGEWRSQLGIWENHLPLTGEGGLSHEERMIWGLTLDYVKVPLEERLARVESFIPSIDNWAICDTFCSNAKWIDRSDKEAVWLRVCDWMSSSEEFRARTGLILSLAHFLGAGEIGRTLETIALRGFSDDDPYYIRMGVAWLFATALAKDYELTLSYLLDRRLSPWIHNKSIQKAIESYRITDVQKTYLRTLKLR